MNGRSRMRMPIATRHRTPHETFRETTKIEGFFAPKKRQKLRCAPKKYPAGGWHDAAAPSAFRAGEVQSKSPGALGSSWRGQRKLSLELKMFEHHLPLASPKRPIGVA